MITRRTRWESIELGIAHGLVGALAIVVGCWFLYCCGQLLLVMMR